ncbi:MAG: endolytic transglycosylase MltG [Omnitrophica WOR_2 bacterium]
MILPQRAQASFGPPAQTIGPAKLIAYSAMMLFQSGDLTQPADLYGQPRPFQIQNGESTNSVIGRLWEDGLISSPGAFRTYLSYAGLDKGLQAGEYNLSPSMTPIEIAHKLQDATPTQVKLSVLPGWRIEEIAATLPTSGLSISPQDFISATRMIPDGYPILKDLPASSSLEGFLFPGSYTLQRDDQAEDLIRVMLDKFEEEMKPDLLQGFKRQGLTLYQAVTLASMVQREAMVEEEMPLIASVFYNRMASGMKLDSDPTVQFAVGFNDKKNTWWTNPLSLDDLAIKSPFNTYLNPGLPPTPIANPGLSALSAVAFPARTPYYYFRAACDSSGKHVFSETYNEHLGKSCP